MNGTVVNCDCKINVWGLATEAEATASVHFQSFWFVHRHVVALQLPEKAVGKNYFFAQPPANSNFP